MTHGIGSEQARPLRQTAERGVVRAELVPPRLPRGSVSRPGLLEALRAGGHHSLTLVSAPAGFGKTTLLAEWVQTDHPAGSRGCRSTPGTASRDGSGRTSRRPCPAWRPTSPRPR